MQLAIPHLHWDCFPIPSVNPCYFNFLYVDVNNKAQMHGYGF